MLRTTTLAERLAVGAQSGAMTGAEPAADHRDPPKAPRGRFLSMLLPLGLLGATLLLLWPAVAHAVVVWSVDEEFSYGFLVAPISLALAAWRWRALRRSIRPGATSALPLVLAAAALYVAAERFGINALAGLAISPLLLGMAAYLWGWSAARVLAFPVGFLAFGFGLYRGLLDSVGFALQHVTAAGAGTLGHALGVPVVRDGLILRADQFAFLVAEQCSGMSSLLSLLALAALWTYVAQGGLPSRLAVLLSVLPLVVVANMLRVTAVLLVAQWFGASTALGFFHGASSLVLFGLALGGLLAVSRGVGCRAPRLVA